MFEISFDMPLWMMAAGGSAVTAAVILLRAVIRRRLPAGVYLALWAFAVCRLALPVSAATPLTDYLGYLPHGSMAVVSENDTAVGSAVQTGAAGASEGGERMDTSSAAGELSGDFGGAPVLYGIWGAGAAAFLLWGIFSHLKWRRIARTGLLLECNGAVEEFFERYPVKRTAAYTCDAVRSPVLIGCFSPAVYLPASMELQDRQTVFCVLAHECMHRKLFHNLMKRALWLLLCAYWWNPLVWLLCRQCAEDMELQCDAHAVKLLNRDGGDMRKQYARTLLALSAGGTWKGGVFYSAFSKTAAERRIRTVLKHKKTPAAVLAALLMSCAAAVTVTASAFQTPFDDTLSSYCSAEEARFGAKAYVRRDLGSDGKERESMRKKADAAILRVLSDNPQAAPSELEKTLREELSEALKLPVSVLDVELTYETDMEELEREYAGLGITFEEDGTILYGGKTVKELWDKKAGVAWGGETGEIRRVSIVRNKDYKIVRAEAEKS